MKCLQLSCWLRLRLICTNGRHFGRLGLRIKCMPASCGVRLALSVLHSMHEHTMFSQTVGPPRSRGVTWSRFRSLRSKLLPQYWHVFLSRSKMLCRVNFTSFLGTRSNTTSRITRGIRILNEMVLTDSAWGCCSEKPCHSLKLKVRNDPSLQSSTAWA